MAEFFIILFIAENGISVLFSYTTSSWIILKLLMLYEYIKLDINDPERVEIICSQQLLLSGKVAIMACRLIRGILICSAHVKNR
ncbi:hypothetical protein EAE89_10910 [Photorhabdus heterorhabditis]|uniref:Uncharacterized protein n=1 Tax=Photorhabdus heterorhabditis TaxID=880156 RepID=A0ABR5KG66_9GAMM|nr:hypothetical protein AM629_03645 [Photorhabdus heterorhabditis]MBS9442193.1 hypothetical protein [Photorhabdus heterorhabditis]